MSKSKQNKKRKSNDQEEKLPKQKTIIENSKWCLLCSHTTIEERQFNKNNANCFQKHSDGITCSNCSQFVCIECATNFLPMLKRDRHKFHSDYATFVDQLEDFVTNKSNKIDSNFIGHCCLINRQRKIARQEQKELLPTSMTSSTGGAFCVPQFRLIIPIDLGAIDILALAKESGLEPVEHYVIDELNAAFHEDNGHRPLKKQPESWNYERIVVKVNKPHVKQLVGERRKTKFKVDVYYAPIVNPITGPKGSNQISENEIVNSYLFQRKRGCDISLIIGYNHGVRCGSILLLRFHSLRPDLTREVIGNNARYMWKEMYSQLSINKKKMERRRSGGSSGLIQYNRMVMEMMATPNIGPRCSSGMMWLLNKDRTQFHMYYLSTKEGRQIEVIYTNPQIGGSFEMKDSLIAGNTLWQDFVMSKPLAAAVIVEIEKARCHFDGCPRNFRICPEAINAELDHVKHTRSIIVSSQKSDFYVNYSKLFCKYTLVNHPVGRHFDVFANQKPSLENRICFSHSIDSSESYGRGGKGRKSKTFCVLDW